MFRFIALISLLVSFSVSADQTCPSNFQEFLIKFQNNDEFQNTQRRYPLTYSYVDELAEPEAKVIEVSVSFEQAAQMKVELGYPTEEKVKSVPFIRKISKQSKNIMSVQFYKDDTDYVITYFFNYSKNCWWLFKVINGSL